LLRFIFPYQLRGLLTFLVYIVFTIVLCLFFYLIAAVKFLIPSPSVRGLASRILDWIASGLWVWCSVFVHKVFANTVYDVKCDANLSPDRWYMIVSNHQSWVDILVLIRVLQGRVPPYKFFVKKQLLWLPFMGQCFWGLDFPVMGRYSKEVLKKYPHLKGKDLETTRKYCEKFRQRPVSVMNFVEGTRFTPQKHERQKSPYKHLLNPRAGGAAMILYAMGDQLDDLVDITIAYPGGVPGLWDYFCGKTKLVRVYIRLCPIAQNLKKGLYFQDEQGRKDF
jgi:1-acyl-sn-glycerol-3-phosphate acyltransferase